MITVYRNETKINLSKTKDKQIKLTTEKVLNQVKNRGNKVKSAESN